MKTPWIDYEKMQQISIKQNSHYFKRIHNEGAEDSNDIYDSDTERNSVDTIESYTDAELVSDVYETPITDNGIEKNNSTDYGHVFQTDHADEANKPLSDSAFNPVDHSESNSEVKINDILDTEDVYETEHSDKFHNCGKICSKTTKTPFSTFVEINDFLHLPIFSSSVHDTFEFLDLNNKQVPQLDTILFNTTTHYPEQPYCHLVCSKIHQSIFLTAVDHPYRTNNKNKAVADPVHNSSAAITEKPDHTSDTSHNFINIRVPVVVGEYEVEIPLEENIMFEEEIIRVKEITKEVVLTDCIFLPTQMNQSLDNGACTALKGNLFIEGYIHQNIEYTAEDSIQQKTVTNFYHLHQKMVLNLIVQLLQVQRVRISCDGTGI